MLSSQRLFLLDYDGTLVNFKPTAAQAKPTAAVRKILLALCNDHRNTVVVVSGRDCTTLDNWLGDLPVGLAAEHGQFIKEPGGGWLPQADIRMSWQQDILPRMLIAQRKVPRSVIEEKQTALVWHYRRSIARDALPAARELTGSLRPLIKKLHLTLLPGHKIIEVKDARTNKYTAAKYWLSQRPWDFVLAAGDDRTDESLFQAIPKVGFSIKVGPGQTRARYRLAAPKGLLSLLEQLGVALP